MVWQLVLRSSKTGSIISTVMETLVSYLCMWQCNANCPAHVKSGHSSLALLHQRKQNHNFFCMSVTIKCSSSLKLMLSVKSPLSIWILLLCSACFKLCPSSNGPVLQTFITSKLVTAFLEQVELKRLYWGNEIGVKGRGQSVLRWNSQSYVW